MLEKVLTWCGNVLLASVLVFLSSHPAALAQTSTVTESAVNGGDEAGRLLVPLTGTGTSTTVDGLQVIPSSFDTGVIQIGDFKTQAITLKHTGLLDSDRIDISDVTLFGKSKDEYTTDFDGFVTLSPGDTINFNVVFTPSVPGTKSAGLRINVEGASAPHILLFNGWSRYPLTSDLGVNTDNLGFGQIIQGGQSNKNT